MNNWENDICVDGGSFTALCVKGCTEAGGRFSGKKGGEGKGRRGSSGSDRFVTYGNHFSVFFFFCKCNNGVFAPCQGLGLRA